LQHTVMQKSLVTPDRLATGVKGARAAKATGRRCLALLIKPTFVFQSTDFFSNSKADEVVERDAIVLGQPGGLLTGRRA